jgi:hypothetical protein
MHLRLNRLGKRNALTYRSHSYPRNEGVNLSRIAVPDVASAARAVGEAYAPDEESGCGANSDLRIG